MDIKVRRYLAPLTVSGKLGLAAMLALGLAAWQPVLAQPAAKPASPAQPVPAPPAPAGAVGGMGDVNIYPKRVVIDAKQRVASVGLFNRAAAQGDYDISITDLMMTPEGRLVELGSVTDPALRDRVRTASSLLRWSPRRVTLRPFDSQTVRVMARVSPDLPPGEYRSHFSAVAVPAVGTSGYTIEQATGGQSNAAIGVTIVPRFGISIPVIVRVGETNATAGLRDLSVLAAPDGRKAIAMTITRTGNRSVFGDILVTVTGSKTKVAEIRGIGVYPEVNQRPVQIPLDPIVDPRLTARGARLTVTYTDDDFAPGKILVKQDFIVP